MTRLPFESARAFAAFRTYATMGPQRSLSKVAKRLGKSSQLLSRWSAKWRWRERVTLYEGEQEEVERQAVKMAALEAAREREARRDKVREESWEVSQRL